MPKLLDTFFVDQTGIHRPGNQRVLPSPEKGSTKCRPIEFVSSMFGDGLLMEKIGCLKHFRPNCTDSYIPGLRGGAPFLHNVFFNMLALVSMNLFSG